ncbi:MAG: DUF502 domain-containing protein [Pseudomonadota bacterium]
MARKPVRRRRRVPQPSLFQRLRGNFLTGLVVVLPVSMTIYLVWVTIGFVDARVVPLIPNRYNPENIFGRNIFGFGVVVFLVFTTLVGAMTKGILGRQIIHWGERMVERMPIVRSIYNGLKQIVETLFSQTGNSFQTACLIEYPRKGIWAVAFVSTETSGEIRYRSERDKLVSVFLPTTPNPTSGFLLFVPKEDVRILDMSVEEAAKLIISAGLVEPEFPKRTEEPTPVAVNRRRRSAS